MVANITVREERRDAYEISCDALVLQLYGDRRGFYTLTWKGSCGVNNFCEDILNLLNSLRSKEECEWSSVVKSLVVYDNQGRTQYGTFAEAKMKNPVLDQKSVNFVRVNTNYMDCTWECRENGDIYLGLITSLKPTEKIFSFIRKSLGRNNQSLFDDIFMEQTSKLAAKYCRKYFF